MYLYPPALNLPFFTYRHRFLISLDLFIDILCTLIGVVRPHTFKVAIGADGLTASVCNSFLFSSLFVSHFLPFLCFPFPFHLCHLIMFYIILFISSDIVWITLLFTQLSGCLRFCNICLKLFHQ